HRRQPLGRHPRYRKGAADVDHDPRRRRRCRHRLAGVLATQFGGLCARARQADGSHQRRRRKPRRLMPAAPQRSIVNRPATRVAGLVVLAGLLVLVVILGITVGARPIALADVWTAFFAHDETVTTHRIIIELRLPRTLIGLAVGAALGLSGAILQGATRNPLADRPFSASMPAQP